MAFWWRHAALALAALGVVYAATSALRLPSDVIRGPSRVVASTHGACAFWSDGTVRCWGASPFGDHRGERPWAHASARASLRDVAVVSSDQPYGNADNCVVTARDVLECPRADAPTRVDMKANVYERRWFAPLETPPELHDVRAPRMAGVRVCVLARDALGLLERDAVWCIDREPTPALDAPLVRTGWRRMPFGAPRAIALGPGELCALYATGPVRCADHFGEEVRTIDGTEGAVQLAVGEDFGCVRDARGVVSCWGNNTVGQLGDGTLESRRDAQPLAGTWEDLAAFGRRACALHAGVPWCWGRVRPAKSLPAVVSPTPVQAAEISGVRALAMADWFACGTRDDGTVWCWGNDAAGQLGNGAWMPHRGCSREGISGTSPEQEQLHPPTPVRTGEAGAYPRARAPLTAFVLLLMLGPLALVIDARKRSSLHAVAALLVATFVPLLVARLANVSLAVWFSACRGWDCDVPSWGRANHPLFAAASVMLSFGVLVHGYGRLWSAADERTGARAMTWTVAAAIASLLCSMYFTGPISSTNSEDALAYLLRDRALEGTTWPFFVQWCWTIGWLILAAAFALWALGAVARGSHRRAPVTEDLSGGAEADFRGTRAPSRSSR